MFEGQPQAEVEALMHNPEFKQLYQRHKQLDKQVLDAELGVLAVDDTTLAQMKREKLAAKDRLTRIFDQRHFASTRGAAASPSAAAARRCFAPRGFRGQAVRMPPV
jgi:uncharacterized protein YdcH (DUF465 family)